MTERKSEIALAVNTSLGAGLVVKRCSISPFKYKNFQSDFLGLDDIACSVLLCSTLPPVILPLGLRRY